jgi:predicted NAD/FAD-binding protein
MQRRDGHASVAIVGAGAAGIATAYYLTRLGHRVELFEAGARLGGNCRRLSVPGADGGETHLDLGVSDFNRVTFGRFADFVTDLGVEVRPICEDATALFRDGTTAWSSQDGRLVHAGGPAATERLGAEIRRFVREAPALLDVPGSITLGAYLAEQGYSE